MEQGLAQQMVYGSGEGQNTKHYYAGAINNKKKTRKKKKYKKKVKK
jgi:hypothetical protein